MSTDVVFFPLRSSNRINYIKTFLVLNHYLPEYTWWWSTNFSNMLLKPTCWNWIYDFCIKLFISFFFCYLSSPITIKVFEDKIYLPFFFIKTSASKTACHISNFSRIYWHLFIQWTEIFLFHLFCQISVSIYIYFTQISKTIQIALGLSLL